MTDRGQKAAAKLPRRPKLAMASAHDGLDALLTTIRSHLDMDVAFIAEFKGDHRVMRHVDARGPEPVLRIGDRLSQAEGLCRKVVEGRVPGLMPDVMQVEEAARAVRRLPFAIGAHLSVPLVLSDGTVYGTFCCFSHAPDASLGTRDYDVMRAFAEIAAQQIEGGLRRSIALEAKRARIRDVLLGPGPDIVFQPILRAADRSLMKVEALARFAMEPRRSPDLWFAEAGEVGLGPELELLAVENAARDIARVWRERPVPFGVNLSVAAVTSGGFLHAIESIPPERLVIEITEHDPVDDYDRLTRVLAPLRAQGVRIAVDDAGAGYASMRHVLALRPDIVKLDLAMTRGVDSDPMRQALMRAFVEFGRETGCQCIAEGVETEAEFATLRRLGIDAVQGFLLARPLPARELCERLVSGAPF